MKNRQNDAFDAHAKTLKSPPMSTLDDPLASCAVFHQLIRKQCANLEILAHDLTRFRADNFARNRAAMIVQFFDGDALAHHAEEELILFPRLLALDIDSAERAELVALLDVLARDHLALHEIWQPLRQSLLNIAAGKTEWIDADVTTFSTLHHHHLHKEDSSVLPFARRNLSDEALQELRCAIVARRSDVQH